MARPPSNTGNGTAPAAAEAEAPKRKSAPRTQGPRTAWLLFKEGTDPEFVKQMQESVSLLTFNGRKVLDAMSAGIPQPFLKITVQADKRGGGEEEGTVEGSSATDGIGATQTA